MKRASDDGHAVDRANIQGDGKSVLHSGDKPVWPTNMAGKTDVGLVLQDDRSSVHDAAGRPAWLC